MNSPGPDDLVIRPMEAQDVDDVARLEAEIFTMPWSRQGFLDTLSMGNVIFLTAFRQRELLGYCGMYCGADEGEITNVAVAPGARREGIGGRMLDQLLMESRAAGVRQVILEVRVSNLEAIHLYEKKGFYVAGIRRNFYENPREDGCVMMRSQ